MAEEEFFFDASRTALAIDNHMLKRATAEDYQNIRKLSDKLYDISQNHDSLYLMIIAKAIWPDKKDWKGKNIDDVRMQTWLLSKDILMIEEFTKERQQSLRSICLNLSCEYLLSLKM